ncbi:MAG: MFS transporter [Candidatus Geothermarchaeales archaeon]
MTGVSELLSDLREGLSVVRGNVLVLTVTWMLFNPVFTMIMIYEPLYIEELGGSGLVIGLIYAVGTVILSLVRIPGGYLADRFGRKKITVVFTFGVGFAYLFYAFAPDWRWILIGAMVANVSLIYQPALNALIADSVPPERRGFAFSMTAFLPGLVSLPMPVFADYLRSSYGLVGGVRIIYLIAVTAGLASAFIRHVYLKETLTRDGGQESPEGIWSGFRQDYREAVAFVSKGLIPVLALYALFSFGASGVSPFFPIYTVGFLGLPEGEWYLVPLASRVVFLAFLLPMGVLADRMGRRRTIVMASSTLLLSSIIYAFIPPGIGQVLILAVLSFSLLSFAQTAFRTALPALEADIVPQEKRGRVWAVITLVAGMAGAAGQLTAGYTYDFVHPTTPFLVLMAAMTAGTVIAFFSIKEPTEREA